MATHGLIPVVTFVSADPFCRIKRDYYYDYYDDDDGDNKATTFQLRVKRLVIHCFGFALLRFVIDYLLVAFMLVAATVLFRVPSSMRLSISL